MKGVLLVCPDTSPRGVTIEGQDDSWDFGSGAGFYVNATEEKWKTHYRMFDYVTLELPSVLKAMFPFYSLDRQSITGHSMGGHGALICALKNPGMYKVFSLLPPSLCSCISTFLKFISLSSSNYISRSCCSRSFAGLHSLLAPFLFSLIFFSCSPSPFLAQPVALCSYLRIAFCPTPVSASRLFGRSYLSIIQHVL